MLAVHSLPAEVAEAPAFSIVADVRLDVQPLLALTSTAVTLLVIAVAVGPGAACADSIGLFTSCSLASGPGVTSDARACDNWNAYSRRFLASASRAAAQPREELECWFSKA